MNEVSGWIAKREVLELEMGDIPRSRSRPKGLLNVRVASWICVGWGLFWAVEAVNEFKRINWGLAESHLVEKAGLGQNTA
jgi:hypothetical protein